MIKAIRLFVALLCVLASSSHASAAAITYTYSGNGSGEIGTSIFDNANFVISALADTSTIAPWFGSALQNTHTSATITVDGLGPFAILSPSHTWIGTVGGGLGADMSLNWITIFESAFTYPTYALATSYGPILENDPEHVSQFHDVLTTGGLLSFRSIDFVTFQATTGAAEVPEPASLVLLTTGIGASIAARRRRKDGIN